MLFSAVMLWFNTFLLVGVFLKIIKGGVLDYWGLLVVLCVIGFIFWLYFGTNYELTQKDGLIYRSGPFRGKINAGRITEIVKGKTLWVGFRPATSRKGLIIKYDQYNEIYISPKTNESFIEKILELNGEIKITE